MPIPKKNDFFDSPCVKFNFSNSQHNCWQPPNCYQFSDVRDCQTPLKQPTNQMISEQLGQQTTKAKDRLNCGDTYTNSAHHYVQIHAKLMFSESEEVESQKTPEKKRCFPILPQAQTAKKLKQPQAVPHPKIFERGLRRLSQMTIEMVTKVKQAAYKEVAERIIHKLQVESHDKLEKKGAQNTKRRIYDVLNIFLASEIIQRNGNKIFIQKKDKKEKMLKYLSTYSHLSPNSGSMDEGTAEKVHEALKRDCDLQKNRIDNKMQQEKDLRLKYCQLKALVSRNMASKVPAMQFRTKSSQKQKLLLPLVCVMHQQPLRSMTHSKDKIDFHFQSLKKVNIAGDLDLICMLDLPVTHNDNDNGDGQFATQRQQEIDHFGMEPEPFQPYHKDEIEMLIQIQ